MDALERNRRLITLGKKKKKKDEKVAVVGRSILVLFLTI